MSGSYFHLVIDTQTRFYYLWNVSDCILLKQKCAMNGGLNVFKRRFQQLRSYRNEIVTWNLEEIPIPSQIDPRGLSVAE